MKRIALFIATNFAVMVVLSIVMNVLTYFGFIDIGNEEVISSLVVALMFGMGGSFISLALSKTMAKRSSGAVVITQPRSETERWLYSTVEALSAKAEITMPEIAIYPSGTPNAFATGMRKNASLVAVSEGLLRGMNRDEIEGVLAHEISHVANGDMVTLALIQGIVNTFVIFLARFLGRIIDSTVFKTRRGVGPGYYIIVFALEMLFGFLASFIVRWFSRRREFSADEGAAELAGAAKMIAALEKLKGGADQSELPKDMAAMGIIGGGAIAALLRTHPPLDSRINRLKANARFQSPQGFGQA